MSYDYRDYVDEELFKCAIFNGAIDTARRTLLLNTDFMQAMGSDWPHFVFRLQWLDDAVQAYSDELKHPRLPYPVVICEAIASYFPVASLNPLTMIGLFAGAKVVVSKVGIEVPPEVEAAKERFDVAAQNLRNVLPIELAAKFLLNDQLDWRVSVDHAISQAQIQANNALEAMKATKIETGPIGELSKELGIPMPNVINIALVTTIRSRIKLLLDKDPPPPRCMGLQQEYERLLQRVNNTMRGSTSVPFAQFTRAALDFVRCLKGGTGGPPGAPA